jgi:hypothetical protein
MRTALRAADQLRRFPCLGSHDRRRLHNCAHGGASEFLDFMNDIVAAHANTAIHVILDNLNTHKPRPLAQASSERAFPLHTDAGLLAQLGTVREVSPRFVCDCCSPTNSLDKARAVRCLRQEAAAADHPTEEPGAGEVAQGPGRRTIVRQGQHGASDRRIHQRVTCV